MKVPDRTNGLVSQARGMGGTNARKSTEVETGAGAGQMPVGFRPSFKTAIANRKSAMLLLNQVRSVVPPFYEMSTHFFRT